MNTVRLILGDSLVKLKDLETGSIDAVISDPPYGLEFMGKEWDAPWKANGWQSGGGFSKPGIGERQTEWPSFSATSKFGAVNPTCNACGGRARGKNRCECSEPQWKPIGKRRNPENEGLPSDIMTFGMGNHLRAFQAWCELWSAECFRILKPNGVLKAFSGTRTFHRMSQALKKSGFVDFEVHAWSYGSGFPKSMDVSKAIDKAAGAEREVVGIKPGHEGFANRGNMSSVQSLKGTMGGEGGFARPWMDDPEAVERYHQQTAPATDAAKQWSGYGTALKPAWEPIVVARKPA